MSKEELHDDEFTAAVYRFVGYAEQNYPQLLAGLGAVVVAVLIGVFIQNSASKRDQAALDAIGDVQVALMQGNTSSAITKAQSIVRDYSGDDVAGRALVTLANVYYNQGRYDEAITHYRQYLDAANDPTGPEAYGANAGIAAAMEAQGNTPGAAQQFVSYADSHPQTPFAPLALSEAGRCYQLAGQIDQARQVYERLRTDYPSAPTARTAQTELELMGTVID